MSSPELQIQIKLKSISFKYKYSFRPKALDKLIVRWKHRNIPIAKQ